MSCLCQAAYLSPTITFCCFFPNRDLAGHIAGRRFCLGPELPIAKVVENNHGYGKDWLLKTCIAAVSLVILLGQPLLADTDLSYSGEVRYRSEVDRRAFDPDFTTQFYDILRTRVGIEAVVDSNTRAFVQLQDSRTLGGKDQFGQFQSGTLNDGEGVDVHQAYLQINRVWYDGVGFKAGRFEFTMGNERVFGAVGWSNVGRAWEGAQVWYATEKFRATGFSLKLQEENDPYFNRDFDLLGALLRFEQPGLELFGVFERDQDTTGVADVNDNALDRFTFGLYWQHRFDNWNFVVNGAYQTGKVIDSLDIQAFMATGEIGYTFDGAGEVYLALGADYTSGDNNPNDTKYEAYDNLYYTGHKFRGYMDYFIASDSAGLIDLIMRGRANVFPNWQVALDGHYFQTAQDYVELADSTMTTKVGMEADFSIATSSVRGIMLQSGISVFVPQEAFVRASLNDPASTDHDPTVWSYFQATVSF